MIAHSIASGAALWALVAAYPVIVSSVAILGIATAGIVLGMRPIWRALEAHDE